MSRPFYPPQREPVPIVQEAGWSPGSVWTDGENFALMGIRFADLPAGQYIDYAIPAHIQDKISILQKKFPAQSVVTCVIVWSS